MDHISTDTHKSINHIPFSSATSNHDFLKNQQIADEILRHKIARPKMERFLSIICHNLISIHDYFGISIEQLIASAIEQRPAQGGRVNVEHIRSIATKGNLREKIGFIMDISMGPQEFVWRLISELTETRHLPSCINRQSVQKHLNKIHDISGINDPNILVEFYKSNPTAAMPNSLIKLPPVGAVVYSRYTEYPFCNAIRLRRTSDPKPFIMKVDEANPPLSSNEKTYIEQRSPGSLSRNTLPWFSGAMAWTINDSNFYSMLAKHFGQECIAGPSGSTDACMEIFELFHGFDVNTATLCCAAWLCNRNDHSLWEVLMAAIPYGLEYSCDVDAYDYTEQVLLKTLF